MHKLVKSAAAVAALIATPALARPRDIQFYIRLQCVKSTISWAAADSETRTILNCTYKDTCPNDDISGVKLAGTIKPGTRIKLCDNSSCSNSDDWAIITVGTLPPQGVCVNTLEMTRSGADYTIYYHRKNNLNGKVSRIEVTPAPTPKKPDPRK